MVVTDPEVSLLKTKGWELLRSNVERVQNGTQLKRDICQFGQHVGNLRTPDLSL